MKVSRAQAEENRNRIIDVAGQLFRENGLDGIGIAGLMQEAGLTHGGFYGIFKSKQDLVTQACERAFEENRQRLERIIEGAGAEPLAALVKSYLSVRECHARDRGCTLAALSADAARHGSSIRASFTSGVQSYLEILSKVVPGSSKETRRKKAIPILAEMVGALMLARAVNDRELSAEILESVTADLVPTSKAKKKATLSR